MKVYLRLLFAFFALSVLATSVVIVHYLWRNKIEPKRALQAQVQEIKNYPKSKVDHGAPVYEEAVSLIRTEALIEGLDKLHVLMRYYPDSKFYNEAKRVLGEVNLDRLLSRTSGVGKEEYTVQRGDALRLIAQKFETTVGYIVYVNRRMGSNLQPGDRLIVCPLNFSILINLKSNALALHSSKGKFFKEYQILGHRLPQGSPTSFDSEIKGLVLGSGVRFIAIGSEEYVEANKVIRCSRRGLPLRVLSGDVEKDKYATGFFVSSSDMEELAILIRSGTPIHVRN